MNNNENDDIIILKNYIGFNKNNDFQIKKDEEENYYWVIKKDKNIKGLYEIILKTYKLNNAIRLCNALNTIKIL